MKFRDSELAEVIRVEARYTPPEFREAGRSTDARQGEMRGVGPGLFSDAEPEHSLFGGPGEGGELFGGMDRGPEAAWMVGVGKPAKTADGDIEGGNAGNGFEGGFHLLEALIGPGADELGGDVEIAHGAPPQPGGGTEFGDETVEGPLHLGRDVNSGEHSHVAIIN